jgi:hypothetical protein
MPDALKRTPLYEEHRRLGGKIVPFAGYEMPVQYPGGIVAEHQAVRRAAGSSMSRTWASSRCAGGTRSASCSTSRPTTHRS